MKPFVLSLRASGFLRCAQGTLIFSGKGIVLEFINKNSFREMETRYFIPKRIELKFDFKRVVSPTKQVKAYSYGNEEEGFVLPASIWNISAEVEIFEGVILESLLSKGAIEVSSYSRVLKTTARNYSPLITANAYATIQFSHSFPQNEKPQFLRLVSTLLKLEKEENELETINKLEGMIAARKAELQRASKEERNDNNLGDSDDNNN
ncbi:hypothetical protein ABFV83_09855 [Lacrimispora sp. BS-2]|uniref:Uncharacterized protein n=1 Tax=Lacrimispora sp. BS-2 TaxID=3151850 RepID=A0AAU7PUL2_9FIRM